MRASVTLVEAFSWERLNMLPVAWPPWLPLALQQKMNWGAMVRLRIPAWRLPWLQNIKYTARVNNAYVRVRTGQEIVRIPVLFGKGEWNVCRHIARMNKERWPYIDHNWKPTRKRAVWRPKQRWVDNIEKDLKWAGLSLYGITTGRNRVRLEELVGARERWKDITAASMAGPQAFRMTTWPDLIFIYFFPFLFVYSF